MCASTTAAWPCAEQAPAQPDTVAGAEADGPRARAGRRRRPGGSGGRGRFRCPGSSPQPAKASRESDEHSAIHMTRSYIAASPNPCHGRLRWRVRRAPPADRLRRRRGHARGPARVRAPRRRARLPLAVRQRPSAVRAALARRAHRARRHARRLGRNDARHHRPPPVIRGPCRARSCSPRSTGSRAGDSWPGSGRAPRRAITRRPACRSRSAGRASRASSGRCARSCARRPAAVDRELGLARGPAAGGPARRRLAGVGLQHDARAVRRLPRRAAARSRTRSPRCGCT